MVLTHSMCGTVGSHARIISMHGTWCSEASARHVLTKRIKQQQSFDYEPDALLFTA